MGMYDNLIINIDKLPLSDEEKRLMGKNTIWQTKDFECILTEIYITDDDELKINKWNYIEVPKKERKNPDSEGLSGLCGSLKRVNERLENIYYHGHVNFYSYINENFYEFFAKFDNGKLVSIEGGKTKY